MAIFVFILYVLSTSSGLLALKYGSQSGLPVSYAGDRVQLNLNAYVIAGVLLYALSFLLYVYLISKNDLGYIIPLTTAFVYVVIFIGSYVVFHETFSAIKIFGIALIILGIMLLSVKR